ncbi:hypothetical protein G7077_03490 [Sphingomonas piscis]|uniref:Uncharacterized protein n=1 Tax=Sphingomonas piscis TaxID=2714943 RepID=A0A6G7YN01_9SPHN|nr:hypothetical protein [Sphingomonas piscis]QIK78114.1 hypothetical protein G7077_03490 [Sphingomonas piscis]
MRSNVSDNNNTSGHTLVQLGGGTSVLLPGTGGRLGDLVRLDLGRGTVVGGPRPLIGLNVLAANPTTGQLATVSAVSGGNLLGVTVVNPSTNSGSLVLAPQVASLVGLQPTNPSVTSAVTTTVNGTVGGLVNGTLNGTVNGTLGGSLLKH